ncbi:MAG: BlaI/MecI/CopY family transcriptional regulator [Candidatus Micrarchaeia archaeon]
MARKFRVGKIDLERADLGCFFNALESKIMRHLWKAGSGTSREVFEAVRPKGISPVTIAVTLDRLHKRGLVEREVRTGRGGLHYIYRPRFDEKAFGEEISMRFARSMLAAFGDSVASFFSKKAMRKLLSKKRR